MTFFANNTTNNTVENEKDVTTDRYLSVPGALTFSQASAESALPDGVRHVAVVLAQHGHAHQPMWLTVSARTAQEAADALGVQLGQIAKSVIFRRRADDRAVLVVTSGDRRVDERKVAALVGPIGRANADFVKAKTGFSIGGVSPVGHASEPVVLLDQDLWRFEVIWAAAGHPNGVFPLSPVDLVRLTLQAPVVEVTESVGAP